MVVVNNTPGVTANYTDLQTAVNSVAPGTLILLQPGITSYGTITIKQRVTVIGAGYFLGQNAAPNTQAKLPSSVVNRIIFDAGSNGAYVTGLSISGPVTLSDSSRIVCRNTSNITVSRCLVAKLVQTDAFFTNCIRSNGIVFKQCYFEGGNNVYILFTDQATNIEFHNNIIDGTGTIFPVENFTQNNAQVLFQNNTMLNMFNEGSYYSMLTFINNIIQKGDNGAINAVTAQNNVANVPFNVPGTNINNAVIANSLLLNSDPTITSIDAQYMLKTGSPAIGYGVGGVDAGAFGGAANENYVLSGIAEFVPNVYFLNVPTVGTATGGLPVHIKVKANQ
jgi:hypothetical protein